MRPGVAHRRTVLVGVGVAAALLASTAHVQEYRDRPYLEASLYLPSGRFVKQTSLGYRELAADMVWLQAVQYYGGYAKSRHDLAYFDGLIRIVNELDPRFLFPYLFGAVVMSQDMGELDHGVAVLRRGMEHNPGVWEFPFEIGFLCYTVAHDDEEAARYFDLASKMPGGREQSQRFAAFVYSKAGHRETSIRMWEEIARETDQPYMRELARRYIARLRTARDPMDGKGVPHRGS